MRKTMMMTTKTTTSFLCARKQLLCLPPGRMGHSILDALLHLGPSQLCGPWVSSKQRRSIQVLLTRHPVAHSPKVQRQARCKDPNRGK